jgi:hypothetical protein
MNFLPDNYEAPKPVSQLYLKLQDGENRIRILSRPIVGWEDWSADKKPIRFQMNEKPAKSFDPSKPMKHFWAFIVWNVNEEQIQIMQITQATIRSSLESLSKDKDWGSPFEYDVKINKKGEKMETEYTVNPAPHKPVSQEILKAFKDRPIQLEALFQNLDPFATTYTYYTPLMSDEEEPKVVKLMGEPVDVKPLYILDSQFIELSELLQDCSKDTQAGFKNYIHQAYNAASMNEIESKHFDVIKHQLTSRKDQHQKALLEAEMADTPENKGKKK